MISRTERSANYAILLLFAVFALWPILTILGGALGPDDAGGPGGSTYLPEYYIWIQQGQMNRPALASAASTVLFLVMFVVGLGQIALLRRGLKED